MNTPSRRTARGAHPGVWTGALFVVVSLTGLLALNLLSSSAFSLPTDSPVIAQRWFLDNSWVATLSGAVQVFASIVLVWFSGFFARYVARNSTEDSAGSFLTAAGGTLAAATLLASGLAQIVTANPAVTEDLVAVQMLRQVSFVTGGTLHVAFLGMLVGASASALAATRALPRWLTSAGIVVAVLAVLSPASLLVAPANYLIPAGRFLGFAWIVVVVILISRRRDVVRTNAAPSRVAVPS